MAKKLNRIKVALVEKGISQTELAEKIGKSFSTVNAYCANRQQPSLEVLALISDCLSVSMKDLIVDSTD
ncbi:MAG: helix-turn-helix transcriptional regulator [Prevotella sp.]|nr:helix-turn-helix transcriptional regulator [Prevotella sp.]